MAGRGPAPKPSALRQRRNKTSTKASLPSAADAADFTVPDLPPCPDPGGWHPQAVEYWSAMWRSPMAAEFMDADRAGGLVIVLELYQDFFTAESRNARNNAAKEIRLQEARYGLDPISRRRLQWEVARGEEAEQKRRKPPRPKSDGGADPRDVLKAVS